MSILIENIIGGYTPPTQAGIKDACDHCEHIISDCIDTLADHEVDEFKKVPYRLLKKQAGIAKAKMEKLLKPHTSSGSVTWATKPTAS